MRCLGRTKRLGRCKNNCKILLCRHHKWQWLGFITLLGGIGGFFFNFLAPISHLTSDLYDGITESFAEYRESKEKIYYRKDYSLSTLEEFEAHFRSEGLRKEWTKVKPLIKTEYRFKVEQSDTIKIGSSKFGGKPDLPQTFEWPTNEYGDSIPFICQLNFSEILPRSSSDENYPKGIFYLFLENQENYKFEFIPESEATLPDLGFDKSDQPCSSKECKIEIEKALSFPNIQYLHPETLPSPYIYDAYEDLISSTSNSKLFGYASSLQDPAERECDLNSDSTELFKSDWLLLMQLESNECSCLKMESVEAYYIFIRKKNLINENFKDLCLVYQTY